MSNAAYAEEMLDEVVSMGLEVAGFDSVAVVALDEATLLACLARGYECAGGGEGELRERVHATKFLVSLWLVEHGVDFVFFEMDVWFLRSARPLVLANSKDLIVAAHQDSPEATNIGFFAVVSTNATRHFFADCVAETRLSPEFTDQDIFHHMLVWHRVSRLGLPHPVPWRFRPHAPPPASPILAQHIAPHVGACSTLPIPTPATVFVHTLGNAPLQSPHGKRLHAKELGIWHGAGGYYGGSRHKYLALDGFPLGAISLSDPVGYHSGRWIMAHLTVLVAFAKATGRVLLLPKLLVDFYLFFPWTALDLRSLADLCDWRETNFPSNRRAWHNATHPFASVARLAFHDGFVGVDLDGKVRWERTPCLDGAETRQQSIWNHWATALSAASDRQLLLVHDAFVDAAFPDALHLCASGNHCPREFATALPAFIAVYRRLRWCGVDNLYDFLLRVLPKHASIAFQDHDCFGRGKPPVAIR